MWLVSMGVAIRRWVQLMGGVYGCGYQVGVVRMYWCHSYSVVNGCCCKAVYRFHHNYYLSLGTPLVLALFFAAASSLFLCSFF